MVPMIDMDASLEHGVTEFYDKLAPDYDAMTGFEKRFVHERPFFRMLVEKHGIRTALDAGCGTGFHSLLLARLGVEVTAVDISPNMLAIAGAHAKEMQLPLHLVESSFQSLPTLAPGPYDAVFTMGNSLAHLLTKEDLERSLAAFAAVLAPRGVLFLQNLNYDRIMEKKEHIQSVKEGGDATYIRSYEYGNELIHFQILKLVHQGPNVVHALNTVDLRPVLHGELVEMLGTAGFDDIKTYGGVSMEEFQVQSSRDLVVLARKQR